MEAYLSLSAQHHSHCSCMMQFGWPPPSKSLAVCFSVEPFGVRPPAAVEPMLMVPAPVVRNPLPSAQRVV
eukprot:3391270-Amphidinium_carterae.1